MNGMWVTALAVAGGGALGSLLRWGAGLALARPDFPCATLTVNVLGSFAIGALWIAFAVRHDADHPLRALVFTGLLGGFTTFSAFSLETLLLVERGDHARAAAYVAASLIVCLFACAAGFAAARQF